MKESSNSSKQLFQPNLASSIGQYTEAFEKIQSRRTNELLTSSHTNLIMSMPYSLGHLLRRFQVQVTCNRSHKRTTLVFSHETCQSFKFEQFNCLQQICQNCQGVEQNFFWMFQLEVLFIYSERNSNPNNNLQGKRLRPILSC